MPDGRRAANLASEVSACARSKSGGGVEGRRTPPSGSLTPDRIAGEEHAAQRVVQTHVMLGVSRRVHRHEAASRAHLDLLAVGRGRGGAQRASGRGARRGNRGAGRRRARRNRSGGWGRPGAGRPSRGHRPWPRGRRGRHRRRRPHGRGECASPRRRPTPPDPPRSGPARRAAPAPTSGSPSRSTPAPTPQSGSRRSPAPSRRAWCRSRALPAQWRAAEARRERRRHSAGSCTCRPASAWRWARPPCACVPLMARRLPHDRQRAAPGAAANGDATRDASFCPMVSVVSVLSTSETRAVVHQAQEGPGR